MQATFQVRLQSNGDLEILDHAGGSLGNPCFVIKPDSKPEQLALMVAALKVYAKRAPQPRGGQPNSVHDRPTEKIRVDKEKVNAKIDNTVDRAAELADKGLTFLENLFGK